MRRVTTLSIGLAVSAFLGLAGVSRMVSQTPATNDLAVAVNPNNPVSNLPLTELRKIYRGERRYWKTNLPVVLMINASGTHEREVALRTIFQMTEPAYKRYWVSKIMRAEATAAPAELFSSGMIKEGLAGISGAIGCLPAADVHPGMKVLRIDGHLPGEPGYPLH